MSWIEPVSILSQNGKTGKEKGQQKKQFFSSKKIQTFCRYCDIFTKQNKVRIRRYYYRYPPLLVKFGKKKKGMGVSILHFFI